MTHTASGFVFEGVYCYPDPDDPTSFHYLPGGPRPERSPAGKPTLTLWVHDQGAMLQLGAHWAVSEVTLAALREHIIRRYPQYQLIPDQVRLMPAMLTMDHVTLAVGDGSGVFEVRQTVRSSGFPPYTALFNATLNAAQKACATEALHGKAGYLMVMYHGLLPMAIPVSTTIAGDARQDVTHLGAAAKLVDAQAQLEAALAAGRLTIQRTPPTGVAIEIGHRVDAEAREMAALLLLTLARGAPDTVKTEAAHFSVSASRVATDALPFTSAADVSTWFTPGQGVEHIRVLGTMADNSPQPPTGRPLAVRLGFKPANAALNFVEVRCEGARALLRGPDFAPVTLSAGNGPLLLKTHYTDGGPPYETQVAEPVGGEWSLQPAHLGLAHVTVDATVPQTAGTRSVRLRVRYRPATAGTEDERILLLRGQTWTVSWYVVSRGEGLEGVLEYGWQETTRAGVLIQHPMVTTARPEVKL